MPKITFSIPAYNEGISIVNLVKDCLKVAEELAISYDIFIIDDGSIDQTSNHIQELKKQYPHLIRVYTHEINKGFGITIKEIFQLPETDWIFFISGDNQFPANNLKRMLPYITHYDFILGYRTDRNDTTYRRIVSYVYNLYISILSKKRVHDVSSIALVKSKIIKQLKLNSNSAFIHSEIYLKAKRSGAKIIEVPILHNERAFGEASGGKFKTIIFTIFESIKYVFGKL